MLNAPDHLLVHRISMGPETVEPDISFVFGFNKHLSVQVCAVLWEVQKEINHRRFAIQMQFKIRSTTNVANSFIWRRNKRTYSTIKHMNFDYGYLRLSSPDFIHFQALSLTSWFSHHLRHHRSILLTLQENQ